LYLWNIADGKVVRRLGIRDPLPSADAVRFVDVRNVLFSPDAKTVVLSSLHALHIVDTPSGKVVAELGMPEPRACRPALSPDAPLLAAATKEYVLVYHLPTGAILGRVAGPKRQRPDVGDEDPIGAVAFSRDGKTLAVARDGEILLFPIELHKEPPRVGLSDAECGKLWADLAGEAKLAFRATRILDSHAEEAVSL